MKTSKYILYTDDMSDYGFPEKAIIFSTRKGNSLMVNADLIETLKEGKIASLDGETKRLLRDNYIIVPDEEDEFHSIMQENRENKEQIRTLSFTVQPTSNCQLGCHYCAQVHSKHTADNQMIDRYLDRIKFHYNRKKDFYDSLSVVWYGGEPLMALSAIKYGSEQFMSFCRSNNLKYSALMITNGLSLKPKIFQELVSKHKIRTFQVTLDGTAESHDKRRVLKSSREATFDIIFNNIKNIVRSPSFDSLNAGIVIRINIDQSNYQYVDPLLDLLVKEKINKKVSISFAPVTNWGGNDAGKAGLSKEDFAKKEIEWLLKCYDYGISISGALLPERVFYACMVDRKDSEVFDAFGNVYSCWEFPYTEAYKGDGYLIGNIKESYDTFDENTVVRNFDKRIENGEVWCKECTLLPVCSGGCPKAWDEGDPPCPSFKINYKEKLMLDYYIRQQLNNS